MTNKKIILKCHRCNRRGHYVKNCKIPRRKHQTKELVGPNGSKSSDLPMLTPQEMANQYLIGRWEEVHFIFRGYNDYPCKTKRQNLKYYQSFFICEQYDHHSHYFCKYCKRKANTFWPTTTTVCDCTED